MEFQVSCVLLKSRPAAAHNFRGQSFQFRQHGAGTEQEHAAVPGEVAGGELFCGMIGLHKRLIGTSSITDRKRFAGLDVAVAGFWGRWHDAKGHQASFFSGFVAGVLAKLVRIADR